MRSFSSIFRKCLVIAGSGLVSLAITLGLLEAALRLYEKVQPDFVLAAGSYNRFRGEPYGREYDGVLNSQGFKDAEYTVMKKPETKRIVALGDSFAYGVVPIKDNFLTLLEEMLQAGGPAEVKTEIVNMGIPGIGPRDYLSLFVNEGMGLDPDAVFCFLYIGNDLEEALEGEKEWYNSSRVSILARFLMNLRAVNPGRLINRTPIYDDAGETYSRAHYLSMMQSRLIFFDRSHRALLTCIHATIQPLEKIGKLCEAKGIPFVVVLIPDELQVDSRLQREVLAGEPQEGRGRFDFSLPNRILMDQLGQKRIAAIDLLSVFRQVGGQLQLYKPNDTHWNLAGNRLAANQLFLFLQRNSRVASARANAD